MTAFGNDSNETNEYISVISKEDIFKNISSGKLTEIGHS